MLMRSMVIQGRRPCASAIGLSIVLFMKRAMEEMRTCIASFFAMSRECEVMFRHARLHKGKVDKNGVSRAKRGGGDGGLTLILVDITC